MSNTQKAYTLRWLWGLEFPKLNIFAKTLLKVELKCSSTSCYIMAIDVEVLLSTKMLTFRINSFSRSHSLCTSLVPSVFSSQTQLSYLKILLSCWKGKNDIRLSAHPHGQIRYMDVPSIFALYSEIGCISFRFLGGLEVVQGKADMEGVDSIHQLNQLAPFFLALLRYPSS